MDTAQVEGTQTQNWTEGLQGEAFTPEIKQSLGTKFKTHEDLALNYLDLEKQVRGKPFRLPESLDKLPDDKTRGEFKASVSKLLGAVEKPEDLKDINWTVGMPKDSKPDEAMMGILSKWAVGKPKEIVQDGIKVWNETMTAAIEAQQVALLKNAETVNAELEKTYPGKVAEKTELVRRMFANFAKLTPEEYEKAGEGMVKAGFTSDAVFAKALINLAELFKEGTTENGQGSMVKPTPKAPGAETGDEKTYAALGWNKPKGK
jgi:hypothetical protein